LFSTPARKFDGHENGLILFLNTLIPSAFQRKLFSLSLKAISLGVESSVIISPKVTSDMFTILLAVAHRLYL